MNYRLLFLLVTTSVLQLSINSSCSKDDEIDTLIGGSSDRDTAIDTTADSILYANYSFSDTVLEYEFFRDSRFVTVRNTGGAADPFYIIFESNYFNLDTILDSVSPGISKQVHLILDRSALPSDTLPFETRMYLSSYDSIVDSARISISNFESDFTYFDFSVLDAEHSRTANKIVAVSTEPDQFHLVDPVTEEVKSLPLQKIPKCVDIRPDGSIAVVGHDSLLTVVDITNWNIITTIPISNIVYDIIVPSNGWAYTFPGNSIELSTGLEHPNGHGGSWVQLHASERYIYRSMTHVNPVGVGKYDISNGEMIYLYSLHSWDQAFGYKHWLSDDEKRIFTQGSIFRSSPEESLDITYNGRLSKSVLANWIEHSSAAGRVYAIDRFGSEIHVHEDSYNAYLETVRLPKRLVRRSGYQGELYQSIGRFAFVNNSGAELYVLAHVDESAGLNIGWHLMKYKSSELP